MSNATTIACYYFPNYHVDPRNEAAHGPGWTEWELVKRADRAFPATANRACRPGATKTNRTRKPWRARSPRPPTTGWMSSCSTGTTTTMGRSSSAGWNGASSARRTTTA